MPRKQPKLILAAYRAAEARRIVANQRGLIAVLQAKGEPTREAEGLLEVYLSSLKLLEDHEWKMSKSAKRKRAKPKRSSEAPRCVRSPHECRSAKVYSLVKEI